MPYIKQDLRTELDPHIDLLIEKMNEMTVDNPEQIDGILNYVITVLMRNLYGNSTNTSYTELNAVIGVVFCAALEHYRTVAAPHEDQKKFENGDVE